MLLVWSHKNKITILISSVLKLQQATEDSSIYKTSSRETLLLCLCNGDYDLIYPITCVITTMISLYGEKSMACDASQMRLENREVRGQTAVGDFTLWLIGWHSCPSCPMGVHIRRLRIHRLTAQHIPPPHWESLSQAYTYTHTHTYSTQQHTCISAHRFRCCYCTLLRILMTADI